MLWLGWFLSVMVLFSIEKLIPIFIFGFRLLIHPCNLLFSKKKAEKLIIPIIFIIFAQNSNKIWQNGTKNT